jgi:hypothetical protein
MKRYLLGTNHFSALWKGDTRIVGGTHDETSQQEIDDADLLAVLFGLGSGE